MFSKAEFFSHSLLFQDSISQCAIFMEVDKLLAVYAQTMRGEGVLFSLALTLAIMLFWLLAHLCPDEGFKYVLFCCIQKY